MKDGFAAVQSAIESTYACLGITCADVGTRSGFAACTDDDDDDDDDFSPNCPAEEAAFQDCTSKQQSLDDDFFADGDDGDDDDFSPNTCADVQQFISNGMCVEGPAVCQTEYEAYVECLYEDMAQSFLGLTCDLSCSPAAGDSPADGDSPAAGDLGSDAAQRTTAALGTLLGTTILLLAL